MIATWEEIDSRFDAIKDHKPRASKKLKELGEILASAYKLNPQRADEMWQYIIELNIQDNIMFSKYYIAQVFNKITENLPSEEATEFVSMRPERVRLMLIYGYDGGTLNHIAYTIIGSQVLDGRIDESIETVSILEEKFTANDNLNIYSLYSVLDTICGWLENKQEQVEYAFRYDIPEENILSFYKACCSEFEDEYIQAIFRIRICLLSGESIRDTDSIRRFLHFLSEAAANTSVGLNWLFSDFLYLERDVIGAEAENIVYDYCSDTSTIRLPFISYSEDKKLIEKSEWFREIITQSPRILRELFKKNLCQDFIKNVLRNYMYESEWKEFLKFLVLGINQENEYGAASYLEFVEREIHSYLSMKGKKIEFENGTWWIVYEPNRPLSNTDAETISLSFSSRISITRPRITEDNVNDFIRALAHACILTSGSSVNGQLEDEVRSFVTKETGSVDVLTELGMEVKADNRTELEKFCDFAERESIQRAPFDNSYNQQQQEDQFIRSIQQETGTSGVETGKLLAMQPQILSFLFLHDAHAFLIKKDIILGALLDDNYSSALKCVDYMVETATYPNFADRNSWSMETKNTVSSMLRSIFQKNTSEYGEPYPESVTLTAIQIAEKCLLHLEGDDANEVRANLLILKPTDDGMDDYIRQLLRDVDEYTAAKKPKGYAKRVNNITSGIKRGIEVLSRHNRMDIVALILRKITAGKQYITGPSYESWMTDFTQVTDEQCLALYALIPDVYTAYIETSDPKMALRLLQILGRPGDLSVYKTLRNQILQKHGYIEGMNSCFHYSEDTVSPIILCKNKVFEVSFLYWNANTFNNCFGIYGTEIVLWVRNRNKAYISLIASDISINGIPLVELRKQDKNDYSNCVHISYYLRSGDDNLERLTLYWRNQRDFALKEISSVAFSLIARSDEKDIVKEGPFTIMHDPKDELFKLKV